MYDASKTSNTTGMVCLRVDFAASVVRSQEDQCVCEVSDVFCFRGLRDVFLATPTKKTSTWTLEEN